MMEEVQDILLVEDNDDDAELTLMSLQKSHYANPIIHARDGVEALDYFYGRGRFENRDTSKVPKVVLLDLKLPKISGFEVLNLIKSDKRLKSIPIVVMTSSKEERDVEQCYELGVNSFITKPVVSEQFMDVVTKLGFYWLLVNKNAEK